MKINELVIEVVDNGSILRYWEEGTVKTKIFTDEKKLFEFIKERSKELKHV